MENMSRFGMLQTIVKNLHPFLSTKLTQVSMMTLFVLIGLQTLGEYKIGI